MAQDDEFSIGGTVSGDAARSGGMSADEIGVLDAVDVPIIVISRECTVARINRAAMTVFGLKASDLGSSLGDTLGGVQDLGRICKRPWRRLELKYLFPVNSSPTRRCRSPRST